MPVSVSLPASFRVVTSEILRRALPWCAVLALAGCRAESEALPFVDLADLQPAPASARSEVAPLRVALAAVVSPRGTVEGYQPMLDYLSAAMHRPVRRVQRRTYAEVNELIRRNEVDVAFVCTSAYVIGHREFGMRLLAVPRVNGKTTYSSLLIVPAESRALSISDLRGHTFAFTDPWSTTGRLVPTAMVRSLGETPDSFFKSVLFTYSHDDAMRAVANGVADGAAVDSLVYDLAVARDPSLAASLRVIHRSDPFAAPPVVTAAGVAPEMRAELETAFLRMHAETAGRDALAAAGIDRFESITDAAYDSVRALEVEVGLRALP